MSEKKVDYIKVMMSSSEKQEILDMVSKLKEKGYQPNINSSDFVRQAIKKWIYIYEKIQSGNALCFMPISKEIIDNKKAMIELEALSNDVNLSNHTRKVLSEMSDRIEWEVLSQLKEKYPNHRGLFNISSLEKDI